MDIAMYRVDFSEHFYGPNGSRPMLIDHAVTWEDNNTNVTLYNKWGLRITFVQWPPYAAVDIEEARNMDGSIEYFSPKGP